MEDPELEAADVPTGCSLLSSTEVRLTTMLRTFRLSTGVLVSVWEVFFLRLLHICLRPTDIWSPADAADSPVAAEGQAEERKSELWHQIAPD